MDETLKANYLADLAILSGLVYNLETIRTIIAEETMYESSVVQYFTLSLTTHSSKKSNALNYLLKTST